MSEQEKDETQVDSSTTEEAHETQQESTEDSTDNTERKTVPYERFKEVNDELKALKSQQTEAPTKSSNSDEQVERLTLKVDGYADEEINHIMELGGLKALKNPVVKKAVDAMKEERLADNAQVDSDGGKSDISRKYSPADLRKMSTEELEKALPHSE